MREVELDREVPRGLKSACGSGERAEGLTNRKIKRFWITDRSKSSESIHPSKNAQSIAFGVLQTCLSNEDKDFFSITLCK